MTAGLFLSAVALWLFGLLRPAGGGDETGRTPSAAPLPLVAFSCALLVGLFLVQLHTIETSAAAQLPFPSKYLNLPVTPIDESPPLYGHTPGWVANAMLLLALAETATLFALYRTLRARPLARGGGALLAVAAAAMLIAALATRAATSQDLYLYIGFAHLGSAAYAPPSLPFEGEFAAINRLWGLPMLPAAYGPLWIALSRVALLAGSSLGAQLEALRVVEALAFCACAGLLIRLRRDAASVALFALNPALIEQYVADGHNDIFCLALALAAFAVVRRNAWLALILVVAAGSAKLPFALFGSLAFARLELSSRRALFAAAALVLAGAATYAGSDGRYFASATQVMRLYPLGDSFTAGTRYAAVAAALLAYVSAILVRRFNRGASWSFLAFGTEVFPWYAAWGVPYALLEGSWLPAYLLSLPVVVFNLATVFEPTPFTRAAYGLLALVPIFATVWYYVRRRKETA